MKHIKSFRQINEEFSYLTENLNINDIMDNVESAMDNIENYEPTLMAAWERCKKQHKYVRLSRLPQSVVMHLLTTIGMVIPAAVVGGPPGFAIGTIFTLLGNMKVFVMMAQEIAKAGPESQALKQEIEWLYDCLTNDEAVINLFKK